MCLACSIFVYVWANEVVRYVSATFVAAVSAF